MSSGRGTSTARDADLLRALHGTTRLPLAGPLALEERQPNVYRLTAGSDTYFVKWIADDDRLGANEIVVNETWLAGDAIPTPRLIATIPAAGGRIACWEWVDGTDLRGEHRPLLPAAFAALGRFHAGARHDGPVRASPLTDIVHPSVAALVAAECDRLVPFVDEDVRPRFARLLDRLTQGYPTLIHGDMHPGNILRSDRGLSFVDWSMARPSLNLLDLDYLESVPLDPLPTYWAYMGPSEALPILAAYFESAGMPDVNPLATHLAVVAWQLACGFESLAERPDRAAAAAIWRQRLHQAVAAMG